MPASLQHGDPSVAAGLAVTGGCLFALVALTGMAAAWRVTAIQPSEALRAQ